MATQDVRAGGIPQLDQPSWELVLKRNSIERMKEEKFPLDIIHELPELIAKGYEAIPEEDIVRLHWWGLAHDKPKVGTFMVRIKVPGGQITPAQLRALGEISLRYGKNYGELTTRQALQLHWVRLDQLPEVLAAVQAAGLTTVGAEGDTVRNITGCPLAGISPDELFDVQPVILEVARFFWGNREYSNLPRKHKFTISACPYQCNAPEIHDIALVGGLKDGRRGFGVLVGGGLSATPRIARDLGVFVPVEEVVDVLRAITDVWQHNNRSRVSRAKARIKFLVDDYGPEGVRLMVEERLGRRLQDFRVPEPLGEADHLGIRRQKQEGFVSIGVPVPMGWMTGTQMQEVADLAEEIGGDIRFTRQQNFIVGFVPEDRADAVVRRLTAVGFAPDRNKVYATSIACTSHEFCNYSVADTKGKLKEILETLEARFGREIEGLKIYVDGCPHACGHHWVADIGLQGTTTQGAGGKIEAYDVALRGGLGPKAAIGKPLLRRVPTDEIETVLVRLVDAWLVERRARNGHGADLTFRDFCDARTDDELRQIALGGAVVEQAPRGQVVVQVPGPLLDLTDGVDHVEVDARTVREAFDLVGRRYPALKARVLTPQGEVDPYVLLYVNDEDIRALKGLDTPLKPGDAVIVLIAMSGG
ncbi:MAG TPA: MoaD/ThiS family protein [Chloroflexota bacterium]